jgi:hypothetical protein
MALLPHKRKGTGSGVELSSRQIAISRPRRLGNHESKTCPELARKTIQRIFVRFGTIRRLIRSSRRVQPGIAFFTSSNNARWAGDAR